MLRKICILLFIAGSAFLLPACTDTSATKNVDNNNVSTIPWNRQEKWENGSSMPGGMIGTQ